MHFFGKQDGLVISPTHAGRPEARGVGKEGQRLLKRWA